MFYLCSFQLFTEKEILQKKEKLLTLLADLMTRCTAMPSFIECWFRVSSSFKIFPANIKQICSRGELNFSDTFALSCKLYLKKWQFNHTFLAKLDNYPNNSIQFLIHLFGLLLSISTNIIPQIWLNVWFLWVLATCIHPYK